MFYFWENNHFPAERKNSTTILIHKKGNTDDLSNFRLITLDPIIKDCDVFYTKQDFHFN